MPARHRRPSLRSHTSAWPALLLCVAGAIVYANSLEGPFVFDDRATVVDNTSIRQLSTAFSAPTETPTAGRPLVNLTFALNYALGGLDAAGYHAVNIAIHVACGLLLFGIVRRTLQRSGAKGDGPALAAALLWTVHPLNTEAVNYITQRTESLMALCYVATLYSSIRAFDPRRRSLWTTVAWVVCAAGMACKESMATAPLVVLLYDRAFAYASFREAMAARWRLYAGLAAGWIVLAALLTTSPRTLSAGFTAPDAAPWTYFLNQTRIIARYLMLAVWPQPLVIYYGWPLPLTLADVWPYLAGLLALGSVVVVLMVRRPALGFIGAWFFITLAPTSSVVPIVTEVGAERRMYLPLMAVVVALVFLARALVTRLAPARARAIGAVACAVAALGLGGLTMARNDEYRSSLVLAQTSVERWPSPGAHTAYGTELAAAGDLLRAETHLRAAGPSHPPAQYYLGTVLAKRGRSDEALQVLQRYVTTQVPDLDEVLIARTIMGDIHMNRGHYAGARDEYRHVVQAAPDDVGARRQLARALLRLNDYQASIAEYERILAVAPDDASSHTWIGVALASVGRIDEAIPHFQRTVDLEPRDPQVRVNLARALTTAGRRDEAVAQLQRALTLAPGDPAALDLLSRIRR